MDMDKENTMPRQADDSAIEPDPVICPNCGNVYRIERLKEGDDYNDFGQQYCPFCGLF